MNPSYRFIVLLSLSLAACEKRRDTDEVVAQCELDGDRLYPNEATDFSFNVEHYIAICMRANGFTQNYDAPSCDHKSISHWYTAGCWRRK